MKLSNLQKVFPDSSEYYSLLLDLKKIELLKRVGILCDKLVIEQSLSIVLRVLINMINDLFERLKMKYDIDENEYYEFIKDFKNQVNVVLKESNFDDIGIVDMAVGNNGKNKTI